MMIIDPPVAAIADFHTLCALSTVPHACTRLHKSEPQCGMTALILAVSLRLNVGQGIHRDEPDWCTINSRLSIVPVNDSTIIIIEELGLATLSALQETICNLPNRR